MVSFATPVLIFAFVAFIDLPVAAVLVAFALAALLLPATWQSLDVLSSRKRQTAYADFAAEFLDSIQGLGTLKAFGQSAERARLLAGKARELFRRTMWVLGANTLARGITDCMIAIGAAAALALGASRVASGEMELAGLLVILMMGVEIFRPMRDLRAVLHQGMVGMSAAHGIYAILDAEPEVADAPANPEAERLEPAIAFENVTFRYPGARGPAHTGLSFSVAPGERIGVVGQSGCGKTSIVRLLLRLLRSRIRARRPGRHRPPGHGLRPDPPQCLGRQPGHLPVPRHYRREHPHGTPRRRPGGGRGGGAGGQHQGLHRHAAGRLRHDRRREGHQAFGRPAPARRDRARRAPRHADPGAGRGAVGRRRRQ